MSQKKHFNDVNLIILGLLRKGAMSAYEMTKFTKSRGLNNVFNISEPAIYKRLLQLEENGFLKTQMIDEKKRYEVTELGSRLFLEMHEQSFEKELKLIFSFGPSYAFLHTLPKREQTKKRKMISDQVQIKYQELSHLLTESNNGAINPPLPKSAIELIELKIRMLNSIEKWLENHLS